MHNGHRKSLYPLCKCGPVNESSLALRKMEHIKDSMWKKKKKQKQHRNYFSECQYQYILLYITYCGTVVAACCYAELHESERYLLDFIRHEMNLGRMLSTLSAC